MSIGFKHRILLGISVFATLAIVFVPRIPQDPLYHQFADQVTLLGIPNGLNVLSNLFFAWAGALGLYRLHFQRSLQILNPIYDAYLLFFAALILVAAGSAYYHLAPENKTLIWDRIPMALAFMSFFTMLLAERVSIGLAQKLFPVLLAAGVASILYWLYTENGGNGDLRPYILIQFLPVLLVPLILLMLPAKFSRSSDIWWFLAWYLIAKLFEALDREVLEWLQLLSGHSLKHVAAGIGCLVFLRHLHLRVPVGE